MASLERVGEGGICGIREVIGSEWEWRLCED